MALGGYIKLHRKMLDWGWYDDLNVRIVFFHLLLKANFKDTEWKGISLKRGQLVTSRPHLAGETGLSERQVRTALAKLKTTGEIDAQATNNYTIITVNNYAKYQCEDRVTDQPNDQQAVSQATNERPASDQRATDERPQRKNVKNEKNVKKRERAAHPLKPYGEFGNVLLKVGEYEKLIEKYPKNVVDDKIANLDCHIQNGERKYTAYKDHYATVGNWCRKDAPVVKPDPSAPYGRDPVTGIPFANGGPRK